MQPIQLTQNHKDKLLEMCKTLFPEYEFYDEKRVSKDYICYKNKNTNFEGIHWFEFCMTILINKLIDDKQHTNWSIDLSDKDILILNIQNNKQETIDYLYLEFLKLKL